MAPHTVGDADQMPIGPTTHFPSDECEESEMEVTPNAAQDTLIVKTARAG
jgi:hypothetical protein